MIRKKFISLNKNYHLCTVICFLDRPNYVATLSLRAYRLRAQDCEGKVVSLLKCRSLSKLLL